jgi:hypothetical protein
MFSITATDVPPPTMVKLQIFVSDASITSCTHRFSSFFSSISCKTIFSPHYQQPKFHTSKPRPNARQLGSEWHSEGAEGR